MSDYRTMTIHQLVKEMEAWDRVSSMPPGKGPSTAAKEEARRQRDLAEAWLHRRTSEP
jgi:hypothetical protein